MALLTEGDRNCLLPVTINCSLNGGKNEIPPKLVGLQREASPVSAQ